MLERTEKRANPPIESAPAAAPAPVYEDDGGFEGGECPACSDPAYQVLFEATDRLYRSTKKKFRIVECTRCGLMRLAHRPGAFDFSRYLPQGHRVPPEETAACCIERFCRRLVTKDNLRFVRRALNDAGEAGPVLDFGCDGELLLGALRREGIGAFGVGPGLAEAAAIAARTGAPEVCASIADSPFPANSCAAITMFHVLEHRGDPFVYVVAARELLRPGGRLIVQVPNAACWQCLLLGENWSGFDVPRNLVHFRAGDIQALLEACDFEIVRRKFFALQDNPACLATSLAPWLDPVVRRARGVAEQAAIKFAKDLLYCALVIAAVPFALLEAACRAGSTVTIEARKRAER